MYKRQDNESPVTLTMRKNLSFWLPLVFGLEIALVSIGCTTATIVAFISMTAVRLELLELAKTVVDDDIRRSIEEYAEYFLSMQFALFAIFVSVFIWTVVTSIELWYKKWGLSLVLVATLYTMLMLLTHALALETVQNITVDAVKRYYNDQSTCNEIDRRTYPTLCGLDKTGVREYEAAYGMAYASVGFLAVYAIFIFMLRQQEKALTQYAERDALPRQTTPNDQPDSEMEPTSFNAYEGRREWLPPSGGVYD